MYLYASCRLIVLGILVFKHKMKPTTPINLYKSSMPSVDIGSTNIFLNLATIDIQLLNKNVP